MLKLCQEAGGVRVLHRLRAASVCFTEEEQINDVTSLDPFTSHISVPPTPPGLSGTTSSLNRKWLERKRHRVAEITSSDTHRKTSSRRPRVTRGLVPDKDTCNRTTATSTEFSNTPPPPSFSHHEASAPMDTSVSGKSLRCLDLMETTENLTMEPGKRSSFRV